MLIFAQRYNFALFLVVKLYFCTVRKNTAYFPISRFFRTIVSQKTSLILHQAKYNSGASSCIALHIELQDHSKTGFSRKSALENGVTNRAAKSPSDCLR
jgi:hypothetical protein